MNYDPLSRLATVTDPSGGVYTHAYDNVGNRASLAYPNGVATTTLYDPVNRLSLLATAAGGGTTIQSYAFTLDETGRRERIDEADGTARSYSYDALSRLTRDRVTDAAAALVYEEEFAYDPVGNRLSFTRDDGSGPAVTGYSYDARDRLVSEGATAYTWDANGNLTAKTGIVAFGWDTEDRLTTATLADGTEVVTQYDPDGNRVRTETTPPGGPTETVEYLVDTSGFLSHVVAESDGAGNVLTHYTRGDELLSLYRPTAGERKYFHADGIGSVRVLTDVGGAVTDRYAYTAFGVFEEHIGSDPQPYRFTGEPWDPNTGCQYHRARWLDGGVGRFVSVDPFAGFLEEPRSLHTYLYAHLDPANATDPTGILTFPDITISLAIRGALSAAVNFSFSKGIDIALSKATSQEVRIFEANDLIGLIPIGGLLGVLVKRSGKQIGRLRALGKHLELGRIFTKTFARTGGRFVRKTAGGSRVVLELGGRRQGFAHILRRHTLDYWDGSITRPQSFWPRGTTGSQIVRRLDETLKLPFFKPAVGARDYVLSSGMTVRVVMEPIKDGVLRVKTFFPVSGPGVIVW